MHPIDIGIIVTGVLFGYFYMVPYAYYALPAMSLEQLQFDGEISSYFLFLQSLSCDLDDFLFRVHERLLLFHHRLADGKFLFRFLLQRLLAVLHFLLLGMARCL